MPTVLTGIAGSTNAGGVRLSFVFPARNVVTNQLIGTNRLTKALPDRPCRTLNTWALLHSSGLAVLRRLQPVFPASYRRRETRDLPEDGTLQTTMDPSLALYVLPFHGVESPRFGYGEPRIFRAGAAVFAGSTPGRPGSEPTKKWHSANASPVDPDGVFPSTATVLAVPTAC